MQRRETDQGLTENELSNFWNTFQLFPWKWVDWLFVNRVGYIILFIELAYVILGLLTYLPNPLIAPTPAHTDILILKRYPSLHILFLGIPLIALLFRRWRNEIPLALQWLWNDKRLVEPDQTTQIKFQQFLNNYQIALNSKKEPLLISSVWVILYLLLLEPAEWPQFVHGNFTPAAIATLYVFTFIVAVGIFLLGLCSRSLYVTSIHIGRLNQIFQIRVQPTHPDKCGGLKPLGDLCMDATLPIITAGIMLVTVGSISLDLYPVVSNMAKVFLFIFVGPLTAVVVFVPLWGIHAKMVEQKRKYENAFADQAMDLEEIIRLESTQTGNLKKAEIAKGKLEILQVLHPEKISYPVWPFRIKSTLLALFSPQILQTVIGFVIFIYNAFFTH